MEGGERGEEGERDGWVGGEAHDNGVCLEPFTHGFFSAVRDRHALQKYS